ncbi:MAG: hypothetical protein ACAI34_12820 [Verrucomicrobium sp.]
MNPSPRLLSTGSALMLIALFLVGGLFRVSAQSDHLLPANPVPFESDFVRDPMLAIGRELEADPETQYKAVVCIAFLSATEVSCLSLCAQRGDADNSVTGFKVQLLTLENFLERARTDPQSPVQPKRVAITLDKALGHRMWELWQAIIMNTRHTAPDLNTPILEGGGISFHCATFPDGKRLSGRAPLVDGDCPVNQMYDARESLARYVQSGGAKQEYLDQFRAQLVKLEKFYLKGK